MHGDGVYAGGGGGWQGVSDSQRVDAGSGIHLRMSVLPNLSHIEII